jgi:hypothetical protein
VPEPRRFANTERERSYETVMAKQSTAELANRFSSEVHVKGITEVYESQERLQEIFGAFGAVTRINLHKKPGKKLRYERRQPLMDPQKAPKIPPK